LWGVVLSLGVIGSLLEVKDDSTQQPQRTAVISATTPKPTAQPTPEPTGTRRQRRNRLAEERRLALEEKARQEEEQKRQEEERRAANPLELLDGTLDFQQGEYSSYITGSIRNNTVQTYNYVQVTIGLYDAEGNQVGSTLPNVNGLESGKTWRFKAIAFEDSAARCKILDIDGSQ
jgi:hypothetical protein